MSIVHFLDMQMRGQPTAMVTRDRGNIFANSFNLPIHEHKAKFYLSHYLFDTIISFVHMF